MSCGKTNFFQVSTGLESWTRKRLSGKPRMVRRVAKIAIVKWPPAFFAFRSGSSRWSWRMKRGQSEFRTVAYGGTDGRRGAKRAAQETRRERRKKRKQARR
jgi:hypothetical protein